MHESNREANTRTLFYLHSAKTGFNIHEMVHELVREIVRTRAMCELSYEMDDKEYPRGNDDGHQDEDKSDTVILPATMEYLKSPTSTAPMKVGTQEDDDEEERCCCTIM